MVARYKIFKLTRFVAFILTIFLPGCASLGPRTIPHDRQNYNDTVLATENKQILLNLVRIHYLEPPLFIKIGSITASYAWNSNLGVNQNYSKTTNNFKDISITRALGFTYDAGYTDTPTISYVPLTDREFTNAILAPINLKEASLLISNNSKEFMRLSRLLIQSVGNISNAAAATSADVEWVPDYTKFYRVMSLLNQLGRQNGYELLTGNQQNEFKIIIRIYPKFINSAPAREFKRIMNVPLDSREIIFTQNSLHPGKNEVRTATRSILGVMTFLSHAVVSPPEDLRRGYLHQTFYNNGKPFDWNKILNGLMRINYSDTFPPDAYVYIRSHGHWFYIDNKDLSSKITFTILAELIQLSSGHESTEDTQPILTIPVK
ncbi:hypothetical protein [Legionella fallonii]|uniref:Uncharacterized protein n=1 Tax=Legionella fallonii LLAP-10 TaxID=1212491 RepID=A0A098G2D0_9GAMM|nr:hypothetical protein [Legionella fallonii]CEG56638.1 exported protein of unknown function [Legionella fallonii LLAP-10]